MKRLLAGLLLLAPALSAYELPDVISRMENAEKSFRAIAFSFDQDIRFTAMDATSTVKGRALFAAPDRMRIEKLSPENQLTVSNGKTMWVYNPAFKQVWKGNVKSWVDTSAVPQGLVPVGGYMSDLTKRFDLKLSEAESGVRLEARPKDASLGYALELFVSTTSWIPWKTVYRSDSAVVVTRLSDVAFDPVAGPGQFQFKAPAGVDVIPLN